MVKTIQSSLRQNFPVHKSCLVVSAPAYQVTHTQPFPGKRVKPTLVLTSALDDISSALLGSYLSVCCHAPWVWQLVTPTAYQNLKLFRHKIGRLTRKQLGSCVFYSMGMVTLKGNGA